MGDPGARNSAHPGEGMLISVEGCVGVGKTTVAKGLASLRRSELLLEDFESNPFLRAFYQDPIGNAIETEFAFLLLHFHQLKSLSMAPSAPDVIADFHLGKDLLYADLNLKDSRTKKLFRELYERLTESIPSIAVMVYLAASTDLVVRRIRARRREFELEIDPAYYGLVNAAYEEYFVRYPGKKLRIIMEDWDFVKNPELYKRLASLVDGELNSR
jgi:deoxyadenosine/deoxycytidine kinase